MSGDPREDRGRRSKNISHTRNDDPYLLKNLYKVGKLCTIQFDVEKDKNEDNEETSENDRHGRRGNSNVTGSGDRYREKFELPEGRLAFTEDRRKSPLSHQRCERYHRNLWRQRRHHHGGRSLGSSAPIHADEQKVENDASFPIWNQAPGKPSGSLHEEKEDAMEYDDTYVEEWEEADADQEDLTPYDNGKTVTVEGQTGNMCKCPPRMFTLENLKMKWKDVRDFLGHCYPALQRNNGDYYMLPKCPPLDDQYEEDQGEKESKRSLMGGSEADQEPIDASRRLTKSEYEESSRISEYETVVCYTPKFWAKLFQIVILAPLLAFTAYLFIKWLIQKRRYNKRSTKLKRLRRQNELLRAEIDRLEAYLMSAQMSPLTNGRRQAKAKEEAARITQSLNCHKQKMRELEEEKSVLLEVLHNSMKPDEDRGNCNAAVPIFMNPNLHYSP